MSLIEYNQDQANTARQASLDRLGTVSNSNAVITLSMAADTINKAFQRAHDLDEAYGCIPMSSFDDIVDHAVKAFRTELEGVEGLRARGCTLEFLFVETKSFGPPAIHLPAYPECDPED